MDAPTSTVASPTQPWRERPLCFSYATTSPQLVAGLEILNRLAVRIASIDRDGLGLTALAEAPATWRSTGRVEATIELVVLSGVMEVGTERVAGGGYVALTPDTGPVTLGTDAGASFLLIRSELDGLHARFASLWDEPWSLMTLGGAPTGSAAIDLRRPTGEGDGVVGGHAGALMLAQLAPGWTSPVMEVHDAWEENLLLRGDLLMPGRGVLAPGMNLANPAGHWHGPMATKGGALFLIHCDAPKRITTQDDPEAAATLRDYQESAPW